MNKLKLAHIAIIEQRKTISQMTENAYEFQNLVIHVGKMGRSGLFDRVAKGGLYQG